MSCPNVFIGYPQAMKKLDARYKQTLFGNPMLSYYVNPEQSNVISNGAKRNTHRAL